jgi:hypothetical protein
VLSDRRRDQARVMSRTKDAAIGVSLPESIVVEPDVVGPVAPARRRWPGPTHVMLALALVATVSAEIIALHGAGTATHASRVGPATGVLAIASLSGTVAYLVILTALHSLPTGYSPVRHAVSDYGVGRYKYLFVAGLHVSSFGVLALSLALLAGVGSPPLPTHAVLYLTLIPLGRIGMTIFPTTLEGERLTRTGLLHYACAVAAFALTYLAISDLTPALRALQPGGWAHGPLGWTARIVAPALIIVVITMLPQLRRIFGLFERVFLVATNVWFALAASVLITRLH